MRARVMASRGWGPAALLAGCVLLVGSGACTRALEFSNRGTGGGTMGNAGDGGGSGHGMGGGTGGIGTGGTGTGGVIGTGGTGTGGVGTGGTGPIDARMDLPRDIQPDVRDTGPDTNGPVVCTANTDCSSKQAGLTCFIQAGQPGRCVECNAPSDCTGNATRKMCDLALHRCIDCTVGTDCPVTPTTNAAEHGSTCFMNHCLNGCSDDNGATSLTCPAMSLGQTCITGSMGSGPDLCLYCTTAGSACIIGGTSASGTCVSPGVCVQCTSNANCGGTRPPICDTAVSQRCVQCRDSTDCPGHALCDPVALTCKTVP
jgi:hypothetical protein